jgi:hypothetical protein
MKPLAAIALLLLLCACGGPRKACRKAQQHMARAAWLCPQVLRPDTATTTLPGDTATTPPMAYTAAQMDSVEAACQQLAEALAAERELYAALYSTPPRQPLPVNTPPVQAALARIRTAACQYAPFHYQHELFTLRATGGETPGITVLVHDRVLRTECPPVLNMGQTPPTHGVAAWYRVGFWVLVLAWALAVLAIHLANRTLRNQ